MIGRSISRSVSRSVSRPVTGANIFSLFSNRNGLLLINDIDTMFQDVGGATPVTAAGQSVALWRDQSGNGNDISQSTAASQPVLGTAGGRNVVSFDGVDDTLEGLSGTVLGQPNTIFVSFRVNAGSVNRPILAGVSPNRNNITVNGSNNPVIFAGTLLTDSSTTIATDTAYLIGAIFNGAGSKIRVDKAETKAGDANGEGLSDIMLAFGGSAYSDAEFFGVAVFDGLLSASEQSIVESYMSTLSQ